MFYGLGYICVFGCVRGIPGNRALAKSAVETPYRGVGPPNIYIQMETYREVSNPCFSWRRSRDQSSVWAFGRRTQRTREMSIGSVGVQMLKLGVSHREIIAIFDSQKYARCDMR